MEHFIIFLTWKDFFLSQTDSYIAWLVAEKHLCLVDKKSENISFVSKWCLFIYIYIYINMYIYIYTYIHILVYNHNSLQYFVPFLPLHVTVFPHTFENTYSTLYLFWQHANIHYYYYYSPKTGTYSREWSLSSLYFIQLVFETTFFHYIPSVLYGYVQDVQINIYLLI